MSSWFQHLRIYVHPQVLIIFLLGMMSGLPFLLTLSTLSFWLAEAGVSKTTIGLFMLVSLPYSLKFLWAPLIDQVSVPYLTATLGRRRSWALISQGGLFASLLFLSSCDPAQGTTLTAISALCVAFFSATQDILIDAYRIETLEASQRGAGAAMEAIGFRFGMLASGAGALYLAHAYTWHTAYLIMAAGPLLGMIVFSFIPEPPSLKITSLPLRQKTSLSFRPWLHALFIAPWKQLPHRRELAYLLSFIFCFKMGDTVMNAMSAPFLCDLSFSKLEYANVTKVLGISLMVFGGLMGGMMMHQLGTVKTALLCIGLQSVSCLLFVVQALVGYDLQVLMMTIGVESFCSGLVSAVFIAYVSSFCQQPYTATHFTLLYSFGSLCRVLLSALAGWLADHMEWSTLFLVTGILTLPAIFILRKLNQAEEKNTLKNPSEPVVRRA